MFHSFLGEKQSNRRTDAWRTFCRYIRYVYRSITVRQGTEEAQLTTTEQGHIPVLDTMDGLTEVFALLSTTLLLNVIDSRQYIKGSAPLSLREEEETRLAQLEAGMLVEFLSEKINLVEDGTSEPVLLENAFFSYLCLQGRWLLWQLRTVSHVQQDEVRRRLSAANFLQDARARRMFKEEQVCKEWTGEVPSCFTPLNQALGIGFPNATQENMKRKSIKDSTKRPPKRQKRVDGDFE
jgi:hypothetical protein